MWEVMGGGYGGGVTGLGGVSTMDTQGTKNHRERSRTCTPYRGRSVTSGAGTTGGVPGATSTRKRRRMAASTVTPSRSAKSLPMHWRGPPPNGKYANRGRSSPVRHRGGENCSGAGHH